MNKETNKMAFYTLLFFLFIIFMMGAFFGYKFFLQEEKNLGEGLVVDNEFNNVFNKDNGNGSGTEYTIYENEKCTVGDEIFNHGRVNKFYSRFFVGVYESCDDFSDIKKCFDGEWIGDDKFRYSTCERSVDCKTENGTIIKNGDSIEMFSKNRVFFGDNCERYKKTRVCDETKLRGGEDFKYESCFVSDDGVCNVEDVNGDIKKIPNSTSRLFFLKDSVRYDDECEKYSENRFCSNGVLDGDESFSFLYCEKQKARSCFLSGIEVGHGEGRVFYSKSKSIQGKTCAFFAEFRRCEDGEMLGKEEYTRPDCIE